MGVSSLPVHPGGRAGLKYSMGWASFYRIERMFAELSHPEIGIGHAKLEPGTTAFVDWTIQPGNTLQYFTVDAAGVGWLFDGSLRRNQGARQEYVDFTPVKTQFQHTVYFMGADGYGGIWYAADAGIGGPVLWRYALGKWTDFRQTNSGLPSELVTSMAMAPDGTLWFGTQNGLAGFKPDETSMSLGERPGAGIPADFRVESVGAGEIRLDLPVLAVGSYRITLMDFRGRQLQGWQRPAAGCGFPCIRASMAWASSASTPGTGLLSGQ
jgi:hypothetical protein